MAAIGTSVSGANIRDERYTDSWKESIGELLWSNLGMITSLIIHYLGWPASAMYGLLRPTMGGFLRRTAFATAR